MIEQLKQQLAEAFGYKHFADMDTSDRSMVEWIIANYKISEK